MLEDHLQSGRLHTVFLDPLSFFPLDESKHVANGFLLGDLELEVAVAKCLDHLALSELLIEQFLEMRVTFVGLQEATKFTLSHRAIPDVSLKSHASKHFRKLFVHSFHELFDWLLLLTFFKRLLVESKFDFVFASKLIFDVLATTEASELSSLDHDTHFSAQCLCFIH